jgi:hypothetical protein
MQDSSYDNDTLVLGFSDLNRLRRERPMVLTGGRACSCSTSMDATTSRRYRRSIALPSAKTNRS